MSASRDNDKPVPPSARRSIRVRIANDDDVTATSRRPALALPLPGNEPCSDKRLPLLQRPNVRPHHVLGRLPAPHHLWLPVAHQHTRRPNRHSELAGRGQTVRAELVEASGGVARNLSAPPISTSHSPVRTISSFLISPPPHSSGQTSARI